MAAVIGETWRRGWREAEKKEKSNITEWKGEKEEETTELKENEEGKGGEGR